MQYKIIECSKPSSTKAIVTLTEQVLNALTQGWELQGGVCCVADTNNLGFIVTQAMIKK